MSAKPLLAARHATDDTEVLGTPPRSLGLCSPGTALLRTGLAATKTLAVRCHDIFAPASLRASLA